MGPRKSSFRLAGWCAALACLVVVSQGFAQIELRDSYRVYEPIEVKVANSPDVTLWHLPVALGSVSQDNGKRLYIWAPPGRHMLSVTCLTVDWEARKVSATEHSAMLVVEGLTPQPDPTPGPGPNPPPTPGPVTKDFRVLFLEETDQRGSIPSSQLAAMLSQQVRQYVSRKTTKDSTGAIGWRLWDDDYSAADLSGDDKAWQEIYDRALKDSAGRLPWLYAAGPLGKVSIPMPLTEAEILASLKKAGGE